MLAQPNEVSTLKDRFKGLRIFAKSVSMKGVFSLVGYVFNKNTLYSFVIVTNNYPGSKEKYAKLEENIIRAIIEN